MLVFINCSYLILVNCSLLLTLTCRRHSGQVMKSPVLSSCIIQSEQNVCKHGKTFGFLNLSRQIEQVTCSSTLSRRPAIFNQTKLKQKLFILVKEILFECPQLMTIAELIYSETVSSALLQKYSTFPKWKSL